MSQQPAAPEISTASWGRRILALFVDWTACTFAVIALLGLEAWSEDRGSGLYTMAVFIIESSLLTAFLGGSFGKLVTRLRVVRVDGSGQPPDLLHAVMRTVLVCLVIPPLIFRPDGRGLHDLAAGTATVPLASTG